MKEITSGENVASNQLVPDKTSLDLEATKEREERFEQNIALSLEELEPYEDSQKLVVFTTHDINHEEPLVMTASELRALVKDMRNPDNSLSYGYPTLVWVESSNPDEFFVERSKELERYRSSYLEKLAQYQDDQLLTYIHPNHYISLRTGLPEFYQSTAGHLRELIQEGDWGYFQELSHEGGIQIISDDPNYSLEQMDEHIVENRKIWQSTIQGVIDSVNNQLLLREGIEEAVKGLPDEARISLPMSDGTMSPELGVKQLRELLGRIH